MKPASIPIAALLGLLASGDAPQPAQRRGTTTRGDQASAAVRHPNRSAKDLTSTVHDLRTTRSGNRSDLGNLWIDANSLKRAGANTRSIEYYASDLEQSLRRGPQGASAARHALNNLEHEATVLRQRLGRQ